MCRDEFGVCKGLQAVACCKRALCPQELPNAFDVTQSSRHSSNRHDAPPQKNDCKKLQCHGLQNQGVVL